MPGIRRVFVFILYLSLGAALWWDHAPPSDGLKTGTLTLEDVQGVFPEADRFVFHGDPVAVYEVFSESGRFATS